MNRYFQHGLLGCEHSKKVSILIGATDLERLNSIFPEHGSQSYVPGHLVARFLDYLASRDILDAAARRSSPGHYDLTSAVDSFLSEPRPRVRVEAGGS